MFNGNEITSKPKLKNDTWLSVAQRMVQLSVLIVIAIWIGPFARAASPVPVFVSINPQKYFVQLIGKNRVSVHVMVPPWRQSGDL